MSDRGSFCRGDPLRLAAGVWYFLAAERSGLSSQLRVWDGSWHVVEAGHLASGLDEEKTASEYKFLSV